MPALLDIAKEHNLLVLDTHRHTVPIDADVKGNWGDARLQFLSGKKSGCWAMQCGYYQRRRAASPGALLGNYGSK
jgi:hypothetical protein